jgi:subtilisin-like proprotein convertase family protein
LGKNSGGDNYSLQNGFRYGSVAFYGEASAGTWKLNIADINKSKIGTLTKLKFEVFGY